MSSSKKILTYPRLSTFLSEIKKLFATKDAVTINENGLMTSDMLKKLDGIESNANKYVHPITSGYKHIPSGGKNGQILKWSADGSATWGNEVIQTLSSLGISASADELNKLDGCIATLSELNYLSGTRSNIQTQLNDKANKIHEHALTQKEEPTNQNIGDFWFKVEN